MARRKKDTKQVELNLGGGNAPSESGGSREAAPQAAKRRDRKSPVEGQKPAADPAPEAGSGVGSVPLVPPIKNPKSTIGNPDEAPLAQSYRTWFLDYASYVILDRAVPHIDDGLKPVQRRILHTLWEMDDGRFHKVANVVGATMRFHPHGDASIGAALVGMAQRGLLIEPQGNFGNVLTGDGAAAARYIEARLTAFALEVVFNPKTTVWQLSYDGRAKEPVTLPVKFPLVLAEGAEGIAVGLATRILPHNFNDLCRAAINHLQGKTFRIFPDFPTGGIADFSGYNDGERGGKVKIRARIEGRSKSAGDHRDSVRHQHDVGDRVHSGGQREGPDQDQARRRQHGRQGGAARPPSAGQRARAGDPAALRLHRLPGRDLPGRMRDRERQAGVSWGPRNPQAQRRPHSGAAATGTGDQARRAGAAVARGLAGAHFHRGAHLPPHRESEDLGKRAGGDSRRPAAVSQAVAARGDRGRHRPSDRDLSLIHIRLQPLPGGRSDREDRGGNQAGEARAEEPDALW